MKVKSQLIDAQLEARATNPTLRGEIVLQTADSNQAKYHDGSAVRTVANTDQTQTFTNKTHTDPVLNGDLTGTGILDEDDMSSDSATKVPTQQSVKAYVDSAASTASTDLSTHISNTSTHGVTGNIVGTSDTQTLTNKTLTSPVINTGISGTAILDDDTMATASSTTVPTSESVKAYVDSSAAGDKGLVGVEVFTSSGTYTKDASLRMIRVIVIGGGGGGGGADGQGASNASAGSGGGGGGACIKVIDNASVGATETVTIGAAGTAGASTGGNGGSGGTSSFGAHCSASGGGGGTGDSAGTGSINARNGGTAGGVGSSGDLNLAGGNGGWGLRIGSESTGVGGIGGNSALGYGGGGIAGRAGSGTDPGSAGSGYGAGGGGGATGGTSGNAAGGAGTAGIVIIEEYK